MDERKKIIISIHFNSLKYTEQRLTKEWIAERLDIFWKYTLQSFKAQTNQDFEVFLNYDILSHEVIKEELGQREKLPDNVHFRDTRTNRLMMNEVIKGYDTFYLVRLDSDNLYHKDYIQKLHDYKAKQETEAIISQLGYVYLERTGELATHYQNSPPFYTLIYKVEEYLSGKRYEIPGGHGNVIKLCRYELMEGRNYLVSLHGKNYYNQEKIMKWGEGVREEEKEEILKGFGMDLK